MAFAESRRGSFGRASLGSAASSAGSDVFFSPPASPAGSPTRPRSGSPLKASFAAWDPPSPENEPSDDGFDKENAENAGAGEKELPRRWRSLAKPAPPSRRTSGQPRQSLGELDVDELAREAAALTLESTGATGVVDSPARPAADDDSPVFLRRTKKRYAVVESDDEEGADPVAAIVEAYNDLPGSQEGSDAPEAAPESAASDVAFFADTIMSPNFAPLGADNRPAGCGPSSPPPRPATPSDDEPSPIIFRSTKAKRVRRTVPDDSDSDASAPPSPSLPLPSGSPSLTPPAPAPAQRSASPSPSPVFATARRSRSRRIVSDDDDDENDAPQPFETARKGDSGTSSSSASRSSPTDRLSPPPKTPSLFDRAGRASRRSAGSWEGSSSGESEESEESQEDEGSEEGSGSSDGEFEPGSEDGSASSAAEDGDEEDDSPLIVFEGTTSKRPVKIAGGVPPPPSAPGSASRIPVLMRPPLHPRTPSRAPIPLDDDDEGDVWTPKKSPEWELRRRSPEDRPSVLVPSSPGIRNKMGGAVAAGISIPPSPRTTAPRAPSLPGTPRSKPAPSSPAPSGSQTPAAKAKFRRERERLARDLYAEFNARIFSSLLPASLPIEWSNKLNTTAGRTHTRRERPLGGSEWTYHARIELSTKVLDAEGKLRSTLVHEMCHAAAWLVDRVDRPPHGKEFKRWGAKAERAYPDVEVATCHEYEIDYRFRWRCVNEACGKIYGRHSKSIDVAVHACGACRSRLEPLEKLKKDGTPYKQRAPSKFQLFMAANFASIKKENPGVAHGELMKIVSARYRAEGGDGSQSSQASELGAAVEEELDELVASVGGMGIAED